MAAVNCLTGVSHDRIDWTRRWVVVSAEYIRFFSSAGGKAVQTWHIPSILVNGHNVGHDTIVCLRMVTPVPPLQSPLECSINVSNRVTAVSEIRRVIMQQREGVVVDNGDVTASEYATRFLLEILHTYVGVCRRYYSLNDILRNVKRFHEWCVYSRRDLCEHASCVRRRRTVYDSLREVSRLSAAQHQ